MPVGEVSGPKTAGGPRRCCGLLPPVLVSLELLQPEFHAFERALHAGNHGAAIAVGSDLLVQLQGALIVVRSFLHLVFLLRQTADVAGVVKEAVRALPVAVG